MIESLAILTYFAAVIGGAIGARLADAAPWKGALAVLGGISGALVVVAVATGVSMLVAALAFVIIAAVVGAAFGLNGRAIVSVALGGLLFQTVASVVVTSL